MPLSFSKSMLQATALSLTLTGAATKAQAIGPEDLIAPAILCLAVKCLSGGHSKPKPGKPAPQFNHRVAEEQNALNGFDFPAGRADGVSGGKTRSAISQFQGFMGFPQTGQLSVYERQILVGAWQDFQHGVGAQYPQMMSAVGKRGLLKARFDPQYPNRFQPVPDANPVPELVKTEPTLPEPPRTIPNLTARKVTPKSLTSHCELVDLENRTLRDYNNAASGDVSQALSVDFCEARSYAITAGEAQAANFETTQEALGEACTYFTKEMAPILESLPHATPQSTHSDVTRALQKMDVLPEQAAIYGQICLGLGYRKDDTGMSIASALMLSTYDNPAYSEITAHHLREGFGVSANEQASKLWYTHTIDALESGAPAVLGRSGVQDRKITIRRFLDHETT